MSHTEIDMFAKRSFLYSFDPRVKLLCTIIFVVIVAVLRTLEAVMVAGIFILLLAAVSRVPVKHLAYNFALALPFILFAALTMLFTKGWENSLLIGLRISVCVLTLLLLVTTTPFFKTLQALRYFRIPRIISNLLLFTYRFIFLLLDEAERMSMARKARGFTGGRNLLDKRAFQTIAATIGMTFVRSNARATNIYDALLSRGYNGEMRTLDRPKVKARDAALALSFTVASLLVISSELGVLGWTLSS